MSAFFPILPVAARPAPVVTAVLTAVYWMVILVSIVDYGAVIVTTVSILCAMIFTILPVALILRGISDYSRNTLIASLVVFILLAAFVLFQTTPLPGGMFEHPAWLRVQEYVAGIRPVISITPADDTSALLATALPFGIFMTGLVLFDTDKRALSALKIMSIAGGIIALWSIVQFQLFPDTLVFGEKRFYRDSLTGFFVNRNTAATFFGLIILLLSARTWRLGSMLEVTRIRIALAHNRPLPADQRALLIQICLMLIMLGMALTALMLTRSRAGISACFIGLLVLGTVMGAGIRYSKAGFGKRRGAGMVWRLLVGIVALLAITVVFGSFAGQALLRAEVRGPDDRFCVMPRIVSAIGDYFPLGSGFSSFREVYAGYHDPACGIALVWYQAHNVYAEGLLTLGAVFPLLAAFVIVWLGAVFVRGIRKRHSLRFAGATGLAAVLLVALHSALDFSLQIPGFAVAFAALMAPLVTISLRPGGGGRQNRESSGQERNIMPAAPGTP